MTHAELAIVRKTAVNLVIKGKLPPEKVIELMDLSRNSIYKRLKLHKKGGMKALDPKKGKGGRPRKDSSNLADGEIKSLIKVLDCELLKSSNILSMNYLVKSLQNGKLETG